MMDTKELLKRISALRDRLDQSREAIGPATALLEGDADPDDPVQAFQRKVDLGSWETFLLDGSMRQLSDTAKPGTEHDLLPSLLTSRGVRLLKRGKELLVELRQLAEDALLPVTNEQDPLVILHREMVAVNDAVLRTIQGFPSAPSAQIRLCEGLEVTLALVDEKLSVLKSALGQRRKENKRIGYLAEILSNILNGSPSGLASLKPLVEEIVSDARQGLPLRFLHALPSEPARFVAAHSLTVAQVLARILLHDPQWQGKLEEPMLIALVHDVGMVRVPVEILNQAGPLSDDQRRVMERHVALGTEIAGRLWPAGGMPVEAIGDHHERIDGTGYPAGHNDRRLATFSRLLAVCDVYAALCCPRPQRPALDTRAALTDTLLLADQGFLDKNQAERLLLLSFHPVGSVVELSDGSLALVIAGTHATARKLNMAHLARPVVLLLTEPNGYPLAIPRQVDLAQDDHRSIVRNLPATERRPLVLRRFPTLA